MAASRAQTPIRHNSADGRTASELWRVQLHRWTMVFSNGPKSSQDFAELGNFPYNAHGSWERHWLAVQNSRDRTNKFVEQRQPRSRWPNSSMLSHHKMTCPRPSRVTERNESVRRLVAVR